jgi:hypothetical protein
MVTAYLDPGTAGAVVGGAIWPMLVAAFAALSAFLLRYFWEPIKRLLAKLKREDKVAQAGQKVTA